MAWEEEHLPDKALWRELDIWEDASRGTATIGRSCSAVRERYALRGSQWADSGLWRDTGPRNVSSLAAKLMRGTSRRYAGDQLNAVQVREGDATRPCKNGREWTSETVSNQRLHEHWRIPHVSVEVAVRRGGWLQAMLRDETNHAQLLAAIFWTILGERGP